MSCFFLGHLNRSRQIRSFSTWIDFFLQGKPFGDQKHTCCFGNKIHGPLPKKCFESSQLFLSLVYFGILFIMFLILFLRSCCSSSWKKKRRIRIRPVRRKVQGETCKYPLDEWSPWDNLRSTVPSPGRGWFPHNTWTHGSFETSRSLQQRGDNFSKMVFFCGSPCINCRRCFEASNWNNVSELLCILGVSCLPEDLFFILGICFLWFLLTLYQSTKQKKNFGKKMRLCFSFFPVLKPQKKHHCAQNHQSVAGLASSPSSTRMDNLHMFLGQILTMSHHQNHQRSSGKLDCSPFLSPSKIFSKQKWPKMDTHTVFVWTNSCLVLYKFQTVSSFLSVSTGASFAQRQPLILPQNPSSLSDMDL